MKILHVTQNFLPFHGGVEEHIFELSRRLVKRGFEIEVLCGKSPNCKSSETIEGIKVIRLGMFAIPSPYSIARVAPAMPLEILKSEADVIHAHSYGYFPTFAGLSSRKPLVITTHSDPTAKIYPFFDVLRMIPVLAADKIITTTTMEYEFMIKKGVDPCRLTMIPNGVTMPVNNEVAGSREKNRILCLARLDVRQKGQDVLIRALKLVRHYIPEVKLEIIGTGRDYAYLQRLVKENCLENCIEITDPVDDRTKEAKFRTASLFCASPKTESFGIVYLEAMSYGLPIVTTSVGGVPEVVGDAAILVPKNDPISLSKAIVQVLRGKELAIDLAEKGLKRVKLYDWDRLVDKYVKLYTDLAT